MLAATMIAASSVPVSGGGGGGHGAHLYWRYTGINTHALGNEVGIAELQFRASIGGPSQQTGGTALTDEVFYPAANAFDGTTSTIWLANSAGPHWVQYEHSAPVECVEAMLQASSSSSRLKYMPVDFEIAYSDDGINWTTALTVAGEPSWSINEIRTYAL